MKNSIEYDSEDTTSHILMSLDGLVKTKSFKFGK